MGTIITCPHCNGAGNRDEYGVCNLCRTNETWPADGPGYLELPLTGLQADYIYQHCSSRCGCEDLVNCEPPNEGATSCPDCTVETYCRTCEAFNTGPGEPVSW